MVKRITFDVTTKTITEDEVEQPTLSTDELKIQALNILRTQRDLILSATDFFMLPDVYSTKTMSQQKDITTYRQALRDLPATADLTKPLPDVGWPTPPSWLK